MSNKPLNVTAENFEQEVAQSDVPVLVDFWAEWCGPCKMISPLLDEIAEKRAGKIKIIKVNVDEESQLAASFNIRSIPTMIIFKAGRPDKTKIGAVSAGELEKWIDSPS